MSSTNDTHSFGVCYIVATPIGNLDDITYRAVKVLSAVDEICAEDTRVSKKLLQHYAISKPVIAMHAHNEHQKVDALLSKLQAGLSLAIVSDAGTPLISDPGYPLVARLKQEGIRVVPIPGACALVAALSACGLPTTEFVFSGFLPAKNAARLSKLQELANHQASVVLYESVHRIVPTLNAIAQVMGESRQVAMCRELTKTFETIVTLPISELIDFVVRDANQQKGEYVLVIAPLARRDTGLDAEVLNILQVLANELPAKQASALASKITGEKKNQLYQWLLDNKEV